MQTSRTVLLIACLVLLCRLASVSGAYYYLYLDSACSVYDDNVSFNADLTQYAAANYSVIGTKYYSTFNSTGIATCFYQAGSTTQFVFNEVTWANQTGATVLSLAGATPAGGIVPASLVSLIVNNASLPIYAFLNGTAPRGICSPMQFCEGRFAPSNTSYVGAPYNLPCITGYIQVDCTVVTGPSSGAAAPVNTSSSSSSSSSAGARINTSSTGPNSADSLYKSITVATVLLAVTTIAIAITA